MKPARKEATRAMTVRMPESQWAALQEAAGKVPMPGATLARLLLCHALGAFQRGEPGVTRAVKSSRDG